MLVKPSRKIFYWPFQGGTSFLDLLYFFLSCVCYAFVRVCLFVPCGHLLGKGWPLGSRLWCITVSLSLSHWYIGSGVVLDCIYSWSLHPYLLRLTTIYDFAVEDSLYHPTCKKRFYRHFGKHRESEDVSPHKLGLQKIAFELRLGFENKEIYTLQALLERYTDFLFAMKKHLGHYETIEPQIPGELQFVPQFNPREPLRIFPLKSAREIVLLLKKVLMNHQEAKNLSRF